MIAGVVDTGDKFITGVNNTGEQLSLVTTTLAINLLPVTTTSVIRVCGMSMNMSFHGGSKKFWFEVVLAASGASNQGVWSVNGCVLSWWFQ